MQNARRYFFIVLGTLFEALSVIAYHTERAADVAAGWAFDRAERGR